MTNNFAERFSEWQNYIHYLLNGVFLFMEIFYFKLYGLSSFKMFWIVTALIFVNDTIIHMIFWFAPKQIRWRD